LDENIKQTSNRIESVNEITDLDSIKDELRKELEGFVRKELKEFINTELKEEIVNCIEIASKVYNFKVVRLENITKENGHPTTQGMVEISKQVIKALV
jgi:predicted house-cleaning noncanonical NTP pyrophosphatase (MazG superfamily)